MLFICVPQRNCCGITSPGAEDKAAALKAQYADPLNDLGKQAARNQAGGKRKGAKGTRGKHVEPWVWTKEQDEHLHMLATQVHPQFLGDQRQRAQHRWSAIKSAMNNRFEMFTPGKHALRDRYRLTMNNQVVEP
jgi:hypothetical protein